MRVVSFWCGAGYEEEARGLVNSCATFGIEPIIHQAKDQGRWEINCNTKPWFIERMLFDLNEDVLWLDADARVLLPLDGILDTPGDVLIHHMRGRELLSGTILFRNTKPAMRVLEEWQFRSSDYPLEWDQRNLAEVLRHGYADVGELGPEFCWVEGVSARYYKHVDPVVYHRQASRRLRKVEA